MTKLDTAYADAKMDKSNTQEHVEEIALARVTEEDLWKLSQDSLTIWSW